MQLSLDDFATGADEFLTANPDNRMKRENFMAAQEKINDYAERGVALIKECAVRTFLE